MVASQLTTERRKMSRRRDAFEQAITELEEQFPDLAATKVPSGTVAYWGLSMGWPDCLFLETPFDVRHGLPPTISFADELRLMANLLREYGEGALLEILIKLPQVAGERRNSGQKNLGIAIDKRLLELGESNPQISIIINEDSECISVEFDLHNIVSIFRDFYCTTIAISFLRMVNFYAAFSLRNDVDASEVELGLPYREQSWFTSLTSPLKFRLKHHAEGSCISVPLRVLSCPSPGYCVDRNINYRTKSAEEEFLDRPLTSAWIIQKVEHSLWETSRAPSLVELAEAAGLSCRSFSRQMAEIGASFRQLKIEARMRVAQKLLLSEMLPIAEVAKQVGYSDAPTFIRTFKRKFGESPAAWRSGIATC